MRSVGRNGILYPELQFIAVCRRRGQRMYVGNKSLITPIVLRICNMYLLISSSYVILCMLRPSTPSQMVVTVKVC